MAGKIEHTRVLRVKRARVLFACFFSSPKINASRSQAVFFHQNLTIQVSLI